MRNKNEQSVDYDKTSSELVCAELNRSFLNLDW
jgi:hypothetical protein